MTDRPRMFGRLTEKHKIVAQAPSTKTDGTTATLRLYDPIDSWGEFWGVSAKEFVAVLDELPDSVSTINLLINSPGGETPDGIAILNALRSHPARVVVTVEGMAASIASVIAMAGDEIIMARNAEMMIHNASWVCVGQASDMRKAADRLDHLGLNIADAYAQRTGTPAEQWLAAMDAETWYSATEAVDAGLADRILATDGKPDETRARFDLTAMYAHPSRAQAPAPTIPPSNPAGARAAARSTTTQEASVADTLLTSLRQTLGLPEDADEATVTEKVNEALAGADKVNEEHEQLVEAAVAKALAEKAPKNEGPDLHAEITRLSTELADVKATTAKKDKDEFFTLALTSGRTSPDEVSKTLDAMYDKAPAETKAMVNARAAGSVTPVSTEGHEAPGDQHAEVTLDDIRSNPAYTNWSL